MAKTPGDIPTSYLLNPPRWNVWLPSGAAAGVLAVLLVALPVKDALQTLHSLRRVPDTNVFVMDYYLDYHIDKIRTQGMDGMNRHGLAISGMSVPAQPPRDADKPAIIASTLMRVILDHARDVDEAVELVGSFNIHFVESTTHFMVADASGRSRVIEFIDGTIRLTTTDESWQVCTNHILWQKTEEENDATSSRYRTGSRLADELDGNVDYDDCVRVTRSMAQDGFTMWTSVYDLTNREARVFYRCRSQNEYRDAIPLDGGRQSLESVDANEA
jgi:hypothetical protein